MRKYRQHFWALTWTSSVVSKLLQLSLPQPCSGRRGCPGRAGSRRGFLQRYYYFFNITMKFSFLWSSGSIYFKTHLYRHVERKFSISCWFCVILCFKLSEELEELRVCLWAHLYSVSIATLRFLSFISALPCRQKESGTSERDILPAFIPVQVTDRLYPGCCLLWLPLEFLLVIYLMKQ